MSFASLSITPKLIQALPSKVSAPTKIQALAIPPLLNGDDLIAMANTGSGKTLAYGLPLVQSLSERIDQLESGEDGVKALILVPTRELAVQVHRELSRLAEPLGVKAIYLCGGVEKTEQKQQLKNNPQLMVATTGRLLDLVSDGVVSLSGIAHLILDEADRLLDMGFWADIQAIVSKIPTRRQTAMFSATFSQQLKQKAQQMLRSPKQVNAHQENSVNQSVAETLYLVNKGSKANALMALLKQHQWKQALVFIGAKENADKLTKRLNKAGIKAAALHGNKLQQEREQTLAQFKNGEVNVLIATDLLARGIDIEKLPVVVNFDLPPYAETYVHRVGRTARAGKNGAAISLVCHAETEALNAIRTLTTRTLALQELEGFPVTDKPSSGESKRAPRDKKANRRTQNKKSVKQFKPRTKHH